MNTYLNVYSCKEYSCLHSQLENSNEVIIQQCYFPKILNLSMIVAKTNLVLAENDLI